MHFFLNIQRPFLSVVFHPIQTIHKNETPSTHEVVHYILFGLFFLCSSIHPSNPGTFGVFRSLHFLHFHCCLLVSHSSFFFYIEKMLSLSLVVSRNVPLVLTRDIIYCIDCIRWVCALGNKKEPFLKWSCVCILWKLEWFVLSLCCCFVVVRYWRTLPWRPGLSVEPNVEVVDGCVPWDGRKRERMTTTTKTTMSR